MKFVGPFLFAAVLSGCVSTNPREESPAALRREMDARFDLGAVTSFLRTLIVEHPSVEGVSLEASKVNDSWLTDDSWWPVGLTSGDWTLQRSVESESKFRLSYRVEPKVAVVFHCSCVSRGHFELLSFEKVDLVALTRTWFET